MPLPPIVLVPGLLCDEAVWEPQRAALAARAPVIIARHGSADSLQRMAAQVLEAAPPRFALAGHSMGGRVALEVLAQAPERWRCWIRDSRLGPRARQARRNALGACGSWRSPAATACARWARTGCAEWCIRRGSEIAR
jgi:pimeloyl-ACP methyl ester carboxylesterase